MNIEELKERAGEYIQKGQSLLKMDGVVSPALFIFSKDQVTLVEVNVETQKDKESFADLMRFTATAPTTDALLFVMDGYSLNLPKEKATEVPAGSISNHEDSVEAIMGILYTRADDVHIRQIPYVKDENGISFLDTGWKRITAPIEGVFSNPFISN